MPRKVQYPCSECERTTNCRKASIECAECGLWVHASCIPLTSEEVSSYGASDEVFLCRRCVVVDNDVCYDKLLAK